MATPIRPAEPDLFREPLAQFPNALRGLRPEGASLETRQRILWWALAGYHSEHPRRFRSLRRVESQVFILGGILLAGLGAIRSRRRRQVMQAEGRRLAA